jgi:ankyrin repeat protein
MLHLVLESVQSLGRATLSTAARHAPPPSSTPRAGALGPPAQRVLESMAALHRACEKGHSDAACALVDLGADVNSLTSQLITPLHLAVEKSRKGVFHPTLYNLNRNQPCLSHPCTSASGKAGKSVLA